MKCHSKRFSSETGWAWKDGFGFVEDADSSRVSRRRRRSVVEGAIVVVITETNLYQSKEKLSCALGDMSLLRCPDADRYMCVAAESTER